VARHAGAPGVSAGQALEHLTDRAVAEAFDLLAPDHDLGGSGLAALFVVAFAAAGDLDPLRRAGLPGRAGICGD
jgi:hypothetical protein